MNKDNHFSFRSLKDTSIAIAIANNLYEKLDVKIAGSKAFKTYAKAITLKR